MTNPSSPAGSWGPIGLRATFEGTSVAVSLNDPNNTFEVAVDGAPLTMLGPTSQMPVSLATGLADGVHKLELWRRSEGGFGETIVNGLVLDPGKSLLSPDSRPPHKIEVLGDSISAGFGDEGMGGSTPATQNGYMAYGPQLARMLDAEWSVIAHSGQGMYRNDCEPIPPTEQHMPDEFKLTQHPFVVGAPPWDFTRWQADVLIVTLGTNDFADYPAGSCMPPDEAAFEAAYESFLAFARSVYPKAEIFALGTFIAAAGNQFVTCNADISTAVAHMNDAHMHFIDPSNGPDGMWLVGPGDYIGDWTHPTVAGHTKIATHLKSIIQPIMGW
jgi:lysophospholipase L1-like esterase